MINDRKSPLTVADLKQTQTTARVVGILESTKFLLLFCFATGYHRACTAMNIIASSWLKLTTLGHSPPSASWGHLKANFASDLQDSGPILYTDVATTGLRARTLHHCSSSS